jgi:UDP-N-acetylmuramoyl-L-alanyl-D-glutamate--2,6-diaminopimelate ligase
MVVLADEDPGSENRFSIIGDIVDGMPTKTLGIDLFVLPQRRDALRFLVDNAQSGDIVFLAGKGHERVMLTQFGREKWNEQEILMEMFDKEV